MALPADGDYFNLRANDSPARKSWTKPKRDEKYIVTERSAGREGVGASRVQSELSMATTHHKEVEDLLWARTQAVATPAVNFDELANLSLNQWEIGIGRHKYDKHDGLHTFSRQITTPNVRVTTEVLVTGEIQCSVAEVAAFLCSPGENEFNATMARVHGHSFQRGSVVHNFTSAKSDNQETNFLAPYQCVKTAGFAHPRLALFDGDERWCFLEEFAPQSQNSASNSSQSGFTLCQRSLHPDTLPRAVRPPIELVRRSHGLGFTRSKKHTHQLLGLSLGYSVELISDRHPAAVHVVFYGCCASDDNDNTDIAHRRLKRLARGVLKLPDLVRQRRISVQVPGDAWSIAKLAAKHSTSPTTSQCVACSRKFHKLFMIKKTRCYLCAHFVCSRCWIRQPLDTANGRKIAVLVCPHCLGSIQNCNYAHLAASYVSGRGSDSSASTCSRVSGGDTGETSFRAAQVLPDADNAPEPGGAVVSYLAEALSDEVDAEVSSGSDSSPDPSAKPHPGVNVLHQLNSVLDEGVNRVMAHCFWDADNNADPTPEQEPNISSALQKLQAQFAREVLPLEACILSNAVTRGYSIDTTARMPAGPIPPNETHRLEAITQENLLTAKGSEELGFVCELATQELSCMASLVTIVGKTLQYVLASNSALFQNAELPREHTLCQHLLMGDRPMLVQHPEADVRFCQLSLVVDFGIQFYAGFPIFSRDGLSVVGSLCCLDVCPREMTQSQYSTLLHLTRTASSIIVAKCLTRRGLQQIQKRS